MRCTSRPGKPPKIVSPAMSSNPRARAVDATSGRPRGSCGRARARCPMPDAGRLGAQVGAAIDQRRGGVDNVNVRERLLQPSGP
jgi:hypothetical protein